MATTDLRVENRAADNRGFTLWGLTCFVETFAQGLTFVLRMNSSAKNIPERKAANRPPMLKRQTTQQEND